MAVTAQEAYESIATQLGTAETRIQMIAQKMAQMQKGMQAVVQFTVESFVPMLVQKQSTVAETVCRDELQKPQNFDSRG